jgi:hypothetical protein
MTRRGSVDKASRERRRTAEVELERAKVLMYGGWVTRLIDIARIGLILLLLRWPIDRLASAFEEAVGQETKISINVAITIAFTLTVTVAGLGVYTRHLRSAVKHLRTEVEDLKRENYDLRRELDRAEDDADKNA